MARNRQGYRGYVTSRGFGDYRIPVPIQSLALRDYCQRNNFTYVLPVNENIFPHSYMVLEGMIQDLSDYEGIVMCSMQMMPERPERRRKIYERVLEQGCSVHMLFESVVIKDRADIDKAEELLMLNQLAARVPKHLPQELAKDRSKDQPKEQPAS
jgi:sporadic carbohydrate cluster protein (TIGR04323 family)